jgi:uncharacterized membrane protein YfcA
MEVLTLDLAIAAAIEAVAIVTILEGLATYQLLSRALAKTEWREIAPLAALTALFTPVGVWALISVDAALMRRLIGGLVVALALIVVG